MFYSPKAFQLNLIQSCLAPTALNINLIKHYYCVAKAAVSLQKINRFKEKNKIPCMPRLVIILKPYIQTYNN